MYYKILNRENHDTHLLQQQFCELFTTVFSGAPFYESFTEYEATEVFETYMSENAFLVGAFAEYDRLVGYGASLPLTETSLEIREILARHIDVEATIYNADLAVYAEFRNLGIGSELIRLRNEYAVINGFKHIAMRTNASGSMSAPLYQKLGFQVLPETMRVNQKRVRDDIPETEDRILLVGETKSLKLAA